MRHVIPSLALLLLPLPLAAADKPAPAGEGWRPLFAGTLDKDSWTHIGEGKFVLEDGILRTHEGMGLLVYTKEKLGDCQIHVVFKSDDARDNAGVYVRIDPDDKGKQRLKSDAEKEQGPWWAVHHGYEVQICDASDPLHRTGAIYSLAKSAYVPKKKPGEWKTMVITLKGNLILVDIDGKRVTTFDPASKDNPPRKEWYEPKREPKRPRKGYIGLQNHDPGDVVYYKEVSVRPLGKKP
jgi:hypothetical protein